MNNSSKMHPENKNDVKTPLLSTERKSLSSDESHRICESYSSSSSCSQKRDGYGSISTPNDSIIDLDKNANMGSKKNLMDENLVGPVTEMLRENENYHRRLSNLDLLPIITHLPIHQCHQHYIDSQSTDAERCDTPDMDKMDTSCLIPISNTRKRNRIFNKENLCFIIYVIFFFIYLMFGGAVFQALESPPEKILRESFRQSRQEFLAKYSDMKDDDLEKFITEIVKATDRGISPLRNATNDANWNFGQALFFSSTVVTTIGYGHVTPMSQTGKIFCILYAIIGIPLTLVLLSAFVERLLTPVNWMLGALNSRLGHLYQPFNIRLLHLLIIVLIVLAFFFLIPTFVFAYLEPSWGLLDAFYYCFISLTTIGLGDYIPGDAAIQDHRSLYKVATTCYLILGLIGVMLTLTVFYDIPQLNLGQLFTETNVSESEKLRLSGTSAPCYSGPSGLYLPQRDEETRRAVVRIRPHGDDSPSPDDPTPMHAKDMRVH